jgi:hypothetical protein
MCRKAEAMNLCDSIRVKEFQSRVSIMHDSACENLSVSALRWRRGKLSSLLYRRQASRKDVQRWARFAVLFRAVPEATVASECGSLTEHPGILGSWVKDDLAKSQFSFPMCTRSHSCGVSVVSVEAIETRRQR